MPGFSRFCCFLGSFLQLGETTCPQCSQLSIWACIITVLQTTGFSSIRSTRDCARTASSCSAIDIFASSGSGLFLSILLCVFLA